ncbi:PIN domain-containing protein [Wenzhouxiangella sp. XN24]|uniref:PIN domain-containing protein n=1 Tax=Wenzhouxiangella sp. XN24 TaxID=2713569 RepID=UPI00197DF234|nr:PIN domain-containing protein [Wenzhouxiangella sp. XN24]
MFITTVTQAEILHGVLLLPRSRRDAIEAAAEAMFEEDFAGRILPFSSLAAPTYAEIAVARRQSGRPISQFDAQIAAIARSMGAGVATRNVADFAGCGIKVIDPWQS